MKYFNQSTKKIFLLIGFFCGVLLVLLGILVLCRVFGGSSDPVYSSGIYDYGYSKFGADFYTYVSNNAYAAASAGGVAADNVGSLAALLTNVSGLAFIISGLVLSCLFGIKLADLQEEPKKTPIPANLPPADELPEL